MNETTCTICHKSYPVEFLEEPCPHCGAGFSKQIFVDDCQHDFSGIGEEEFIICKNCGYIEIVGDEEDGDEEDYLRTCPDCWHTEEYCECGELSPEARHDDDCPCLCCLENKRDVSQQETTD